MKKFLLRYGTNIGAITGTIAGYEAAKKYKKDTFYYTILGGFVGMVLVNLITDSLEIDK